MNDRDFMRYSRQILLEDIAIDGQQKLLASRVLIVGLGGLGAPAALYLAGAGIGTLVLADDDEVHLSNLQRQILFTTEDINQPKAQITRQRLHQLNPDIELIALQERLGGESLHRKVALADVVLDCTDNMATRQAINVEEGHGATFQTDPAARHEVGERLVNRLTGGANQLGQLFLREVVRHVDALVGCGAEAVSKIQEVNAFLQQDVNDKFTFEETIQLLEHIFEGS